MDYEIVRVYMVLTLIEATIEPIYSRPIFSDHLRCYCYRYLLYKSPRPMINFCFENWWEIYAYFHLTASPPHHLHGMIPPSSIYLIQ